MEIAFENVLFCLCIAIFLYRIVKPRGEHESKQGEIRR